MTTRQTVKRDYKFTAYDSKGKEIKLNCANVFYAITEEEAKMVRIGFELGLMQKYQSPIVCFDRI